LLINPTNLANQSYFASLIARPSQKFITDMDYPEGELIGENCKKLQKNSVSTDHNKACNAKVRAGRMARRRAGRKA